MSTFSDMLRLTRIYVAIVTLFSTSYCQEWCLGD